MAKKEAAAKEAPDQQAQGNMPLFYKTPTPLDAKKHNKMGLKKGFGLSFAKGVNAVPINMIEMPQARTTQACSKTQPFEPVINTGESLVIHAATDKREGWLVA